MLLLETFCSLPVVVAQGCLSTALLLLIRQDRPTPFLCSSPCPLNIRLVYLLFVPLIVSPSSSADLFPSPLRHLPRHRRFFLLAIHSCPSSWVPKMPLQTATTLIGGLLPILGCGCFRRCFAVIGFLGSGGVAPDITGFVGRVGHRRFFLLAIRSSTSSPQHSCRKAHHSHCQSLSTLNSRSGTAPRPSALPNRRCRLYTSPTASRS
jgi:hypothetical protein